MRTASPHIHAWSAHTLHQSRLPGNIAATSHDSLQPEGRVYSPAGPASAWLLLLSCPIPSAGCSSHLLPCPNDLQNEGCMCRQAAGPVALSATMTLMPAYHPASIRQGPADREADRHNVEAAQSNGEGLSTCRLRLTIMCSHQCSGHSLTAVA